MSDTVYVGSHEFVVDLQRMSDAIGGVGSARDVIKEAFSAVVREFEVVETSWSGPAGESYASFKDSLTAAAQKLLELLDDMVTRMQATYQTYQDTENANAANLT
jgi:WXG100 family type VII secretion target